MLSFCNCLLWNSKYYDQKEISHYSPFMQTNYYYIILFRVSLFYLVLRKYVILPNLNWKILFVYEHVWSCLLGFIVEVKIIEKFYYLTWKMNFYSYMTDVLFYQSIVSYYHWRYYLWRRLYYLFFSWNIWSHSSSPLFCLYIQGTLSIQH